jgi:hypothetical protein
MSSKKRPPKRPPTLPAVIQTKSKREMLDSVMNDKMPHKTDDVLPVLTQMGAFNGYNAAELMAIGMRSIIEDEIRKRRDKEGKRLYPSVRLHDETGKTYNAYVHRDGMTDAQKVEEVNAYTDSAVNTVKARNILVPEINQKRIEASQQKMLGQKKRTAKYLAERQQSLLPLLEINEVPAEKQIPFPNNESQQNT